MSQPAATSAPQAASPPPTGLDRWATPTLLVCTLTLSIFFSWPVAAHFFTAVPYSLFPIPGYELTPLVPGDYLQSYYWFWVFSDTIFGQSPWLTNIYEFNAGDARLVGQFANFPLSAAWTAFLFLGPVGAYNALVLLAPVLTALAAFKLARGQGADPWSAWPAALALAFCPILFSQLAAGQIKGMVACLLPLAFYWLEKAWTSRRYLYGLGAGACIFTLALMEPHLTYFTTLAMGLYLPARLFLTWDQQAPWEEEGSGEMAWGQLAWVLAGGLAVGLFAALRLGRQPQAPPLSGLLLESLLLWPLAALVVWLTLACLLARLRGLPFNLARRAAARPFLALLLLALYSMQMLVNVPHLGAILLAVGLGLFALGQARACLLASKPPHALAWPSLAAAGLGLGLGLAGSAAHLLYIRAVSYAGSVVDKGRGINEILLFSPQPQSLLDMTPGPDERFILLGFSLLGLALLGFLPLMGRRGPANPGRRVLALLLAYLATVLALGPAITTLPLYRLLHQYLPFFHYPRVPGRFIVFAILFLGVLGTWGLMDLRRWLLARGWLWAARLAPLLALLGLLLEFYPGPPGLAFFPPENRVLTHLASEPKETGLVLELPIWPGDSHQSALYEYDVTRTKRPMVNGYSPFVTKQYLEQVFEPLYPLDLGELGPEQANSLHQLKVGRVVYHDDATVYTLKVSPFPPSLALARLEASGWLEPLERQGNLHLFAPRSQPRPPVRPPREITSPVNAVFYAQEMLMDRGQRIYQPQASGHGLLLDETADQSQGPVYKRQAQGNLVRTQAGRDQPGYLVKGPGRVLPPGSYVARFRLRAAEALPLDSSPGRLEVGPAGQTLAQRDLQAGEFSQAGQWVDAALPFSLDSVAPLEFRLFSHGRHSLDFNLVVVAFAGVESGPGSWQAQDLFRQTGQVVDDPLAGGGRAVGVRAGYHPPIYMLHGPYQTLEPGSYVARFFLRAPGPDGGKPSQALLEAATDMGRRVLGQRQVSLEPQSGGGYVALEVPFSVPFRCELDLRVRYLGGGDLLADRVEVVRAPRP